MEYCLKCKNENPEDREVCICGGRNFVYGDIIKRESTILCICGRENFTIQMHINMGKIHEYKYRCDCGKIIGVQKYKGRR